jgi:signal transduction histidine kinase
LFLARQFLDRSRAEVHRTVWDLRAHGLEGRDFLDVLRERAAAMVSGSSVVLSVEVEGGAVPLSDFIAGNLLLLAQEAVTNALKHAAPGRIDVQLSFPIMQVLLEVKDDGRGFDPAAAPGHRDGHFGLQGMHERAKRLGGKLAVESSPGRGTCVSVLLPAADPKAESGGADQPRGGLM